MSTTGSEPPDEVYRPPAVRREPGRWFNLLPVAFSGPIHWLLTAPQRLVQLQSVAQVAEDRRTREIALESLDKAYQLAPPHANAAALQTVWDQRLPFCLYLRSYDFTTRVVGTAAPTVEPPFGEMIAVNPVHDLQLRYLVKTTLPGIPVIAVVNPLDPPAEAGDFRYHDSEWRARVGELVRAAQMIVMYLRGEDAGVAEEMQMIRDARRGDRTIVIVGNKDVFSFAGHIGGIAAADANWERKRTMKDAVAPVNVDGFPHVLAQEMPGFDQAVATLATQLVKEPAPREFSATAPLPHVPLLTAAERDAVIQSGIVAVNVARHWLAQNSVLRAEASFDEAWARFFAVDATRHRASVALEMGTLYLTRANEPGNAAKRFQEASRLYRRLDVPTMLLTASQQLASALLGIDPPALDAARAALEEAERLQPSSPDAWTTVTIAHVREWLERLSRNEAAARDARALSVRVYGAFRDAGGVPQRPDALTIAQIHDESMRAGSPDASTFLRTNQRMSTLPQVRNALIAAVGDRQGRSTLLEQTTTADLEWELARLFDALVDRSG